MAPFRRFIANVSWTVLGKICVQGVLFFLSILLTRYLGKERLGIYATLLVIPVFARLVNSFGLETVLNKRLPQLNVDDPSGVRGRGLVRRLVLWRLLTGAGIALLLYGFFPMYLHFISLPGLLEYRGALILYFLAITVDSLLSTLFMTLLRFRVIAVSETLCAGLNLVLLGVFIWADWGIFAVLYAYIISAGVNIVIYLVCSRDFWTGPAAAPEWREMKPLAAASYGISILGFGLMAQSDVFLMNYFGVDSGDVGYYHLSTGLVGMMGFLLAGVAPMALSLFSETFSVGQERGLSRLWCEVVGFASFLTAPIYVFGFFHAESLITFIYGGEFGGAAAVLAVFALFSGCQTVLGYNFSVSALFVLDRQRAAVRTTVESAALNVILDLFLIPPLGAMGAVAATGSSLVYLVVRQLLILNREMDIRPAFGPVSRCLL
ncbi:MAG: hypothetical protein COV67_00325, partial [Nitrospinae bacterium CG11_big_fil_rev_8_21_14_0_20_56_8]